MSNRKNKREVLVIGAGPVGLAAAVTAVLHGCQVTVLDQGRVGEHLLQWGHVRLFTPWSLNLSAAMRDVLESQPEPDACPTGRELVEEALVPISEWLAEKASLLTHTRVVALGRGDLLKSEAIVGTGDARRVSQKFTVLLEGRAEDSVVRATSKTEKRVTADVVIDASGVYGQSNWVGRGGIPAVGERGLWNQLHHGLPDVLGRDRGLFEGKRVAVIGGGASACTTVRALGQLPGVEVSWITRGEGDPVTPIPQDPLPERKQLALDVLALAQGSANVSHSADRTVTGLARESGVWTLSLHARDGSNSTLVCDEVVVQTGFRPDHRLAEELQFHECYASEGPMKLAGALLSSAGSGGDCMDQSSQGAESLLNPEPNYFVVGHKSYGRAANFLLRIGYEQVEDVFRLLSENESNINDTNAGALS